jgi:Zn-finger nucleic acid-binding protein
LPGNLHIVTASEGIEYAYSSCRRCKGVRVTRAALESLFVERVDALLPNQFREEQRRRKASPTGTARALDAEITLACDVAASPLAARP